MSSVRHTALHRQDLMSLAVLVMSPHVQVRDARPSLPNPSRLYASSESLARLEAQIYCL